MKRLVLVLMAAALLGGLSGCAHCATAYPRCGPFSALRSARQVCACHGIGCRLCRRGGPGIGTGSGTGHPMGVVSYPYYTLRGPRDFLASDPRSIGP